MQIGNSETLIVNEITDQIAEILRRAGLFHRVFSRLKSPDSIKKKLDSKQGDYEKSGKKMQDLIGIRITLYFSDDEEIAMTILKEKFIEVAEGHSIDQVDNDRFGPTRLNLVFRLGQDLSSRSRLFSHLLIDDTFEVQIRTVFSEGWHEVEHDLRYKCKNDWSNEEVLSRQLNGQLATLESCNWAMLKIFDELAYNKYKSRDWNSFLRNTLRIRFEDSSLGADIFKFLTQNTNIAKELLRADRKQLILPLLKITNKIPLKMDNVLFILNRAYLHNETLVSMESTLLKNILDNSIFQ